MIAVDEPDGTTDIYRYKCCCNSSHAPCKKKRDCPKGKNDFYISGEVEDIPDEAMISVEKVNTSELDDMEIDNVGYIHCDAQGSENFIFSKGREFIKKNRPVILYENKDFYGTYLYDNIVKNYPNYLEESKFDIKKYCMEELNYTKYIDRYEGGIDTLLIP